MKIEVFNGFDENAAYLLLSFLLYGKCYQKITHWAHENRLSRYIILDFGFGNFSGVEVIARCPQEIDTEHLLRPRKE